MTLKQHSRAFAGLAAAGLSYLVSGPAIAAGGYSILEIGTRDTGLACAGYAARADDAGTEFTNPAGMTRLAGNDTVLGGELIYGNYDFSPNSNTSVAGNGGGNPVGLAPSAGAFYVHSVSNDLKVGIGVGSNFAFQTKWNDGWVGRYYGTKLDMVGITLLPSIAYKVNDKLSLGLGMNVMYGTADLETNINNLLPVGVGDGLLVFKDNVWGFGATVGMLYEFSPQTRVGATYNSQINLNFQAVPRFSNLGDIGNALQSRGFLTNQLKIGETVPQAVMVSIYHGLEAAPRWAILGNVGWQQWAKFGQIELGVDSSSGANLNKTTASVLKNTWHAAVGTEFKYSDPLLLTAGLAYDSTMVDDDNRSPNNPVGATYSIGFGARYKIRSGYDLSVGYELKWSGDLSVDQTHTLLGRVAGTYQSTALNFVTATLHWGQ